MNKWQDKATAGIKVATDILFVRNPVGTSMGVLLGVVLHGIAGFLSPLLETIQQIKMSALNMGHYIAIGVFSFNIKGFTDRHKIDPEVEEAITFIEQQVASRKITRAEAKLQYRRLISKVVENVQLDLMTQSKANAIRSALAKRR